MKVIFKKILQHPATIPATIGVVAFGVGGAAGYILGSRLEKKVGEPDDNNTQLQFDFNSAVYADISVSDELDEPSRGVMTDIISDEAYEPVEEPIEEPIIVEHRNIFAHSDSWDYDREVKSRHPDKPYVIHRDEFFSGESGFDQISVMYYAGDDIACDEQDVPIFNHSKLLGNLDFGHGSDDPKIVYIRNEKREAEYEVIHDPNCFSEVMYGLEVENNLRVREVKKAKKQKFKEDE